MRNFILLKTHKNPNTSTIYEYLKLCSGNPPKSIRIHILGVAQKNRAHKLMEPISCNISSELENGGFSIHLPKKTIKIP